VTGLLVVIRPLLAVLRPFQHVIRRPAQPFSPTTSLLTTVEISSPSPTLPVSDVVPVFNAVDEMSRDVFSDDPAKPGQPSTTPSEQPLLPPSGEI
jgi:hypothetical protein